MKKTGRKSCLSTLKKDTEKSLDSAQYDTARNLTQRRIILRRTSKKFEYLGENETEFENILTHWSVAQAGSNDEKNWGSKISLDCPFKPGMRIRLNSICFAGFGSTLQSEVLLNST